MKKEIEISGIVCKFKTSAAIPRIYRIKFHRDIFVDLNKIDKEVKKQEKLKKEAMEAARAAGVEFDEDEFESQLPIETLETFENIAYIMHKHGDKNQPDSIDEWLEQFDTFDIYKIFPDILGMWAQENETMSESKKKIEQLTAK